MYKIAPRQIAKSKGIVTGRQTINSNPEKIHIEAAIFVQAQKALVFLRGHATAIGTSQNSSSRPKKSFEARLTGPLFSSSS